MDNNRIKQISIIVILMTMQTSCLNTFSIRPYINNESLWFEFDNGYFRKKEAICVNNFTIYKRDIDESENIIFRMASNKCVNLEMVSTEVIPNGMNLEKNSEITNGCYRASAKSGDGRTGFSKLFRLNHGKLIMDGC